MLFLGVVSLLYTTQMDRVCDGVNWEIGWSTGESELGSGEKGEENLPIPREKGKLQEVREHIIDQHHKRAIWRNLLERGKNRSWFHRMHTRKRTHMHKNTITHFREW